MGPLAPLDHRSISYEDFAKDLYDEPASLQGLSQAEVNARRRQLGIRVAGYDPPKPVQSFADCGLDADLLSVMAKAGLREPTPIQAQALPAALSGRYGSCSGSI